MINKPNVPRNMLRVNGTWIPNPKHGGFSWEEIDIDYDAKRNQLGTLIRNRIAKKKKLVCSWGPLTNAEISLLLNATENQHFTLNFPDARTGGRSTGTFYVGDRSAPAYYIDSTTGEALWEGLSMNFIEV